MYGMWDSRTVRAARIYLQTGAPKQVRVSSGWERLGPGREGPPHSPLPLHRPFNRQHLPPLHWQITQPAGDPPGPFISLFRQVINTSSWAFLSSAFQPTHSWHTLYSQERVEKSSSCRNFCTNPGPESLHGVPSSSFLQVVTPWWVIWGLGWVEGNFHPNFWLS